MEFTGWDHCYFAAAFRFGWLADSWVSGDVGEIIKYGTYMRNKYRYTNINVERWREEEALCLTKLASWEMAVD